MISRRKILAACTGALMCLGSLPALPALAAGPAIALDDRARAVVSQLETYLNSITTLKARFLQTSSASGLSVEGTAYISRPGRMRLQYDPPSPLLIVANGTFLIIHDKELGDPTYLPLDSTPAGMLVRSNLRLTGGDLAITHISRKAGVVELSLVDAKDPAQGELTLVFTDSPLQLRQWRVVDPQGNVTQVSLYDLQTGQALDKKLFEFVDPKFQQKFRND